MKKILLRAGGLVLGSLTLALTTSAQYTITLLHNNDGESNLIDAGPDLPEYAGAARFVTLVNETRAEFEALGHGVVTVSSGDNFLPGNTFDASLESNVFYDAIVLNAIGYDAIILGNHDFDLGPVVLGDFLFAMDPAIPYLSATLDFSDEPTLSLFEEAGRLDGSTIVEVATATGLVQVGIVGATTPNLPFISSPGRVTVTPQAELATVVQAEIDTVIAAGAEVVIFVSHLQGSAEDRAIIAQLTGIDAAVAGGGDELLANAGTPVIPGDEIDSVNNPYPLLVPDADGNDVPLVTTTANYRYLGVLSLEFDADGALVAATGGPRRVVDVSTGEPDGVVADAVVFTTAVQPVIDYIDNLDSILLAAVDVTLDGRSDSIRSFETGLGNLIADAQLWVARRDAETFGVTSTVDAAVIGAGGIRNDILFNPEGRRRAFFSRALATTLLPFSNDVTIVENLAPEDFVALLENNYSRTELINGMPDREGGGTGRFGQLAGVDVVYDITEPPVVIDSDTGVVTQEGSRLQSVVLHDGTVILEDGELSPTARPVNIVVTSFHATRGDSGQFGDQFFHTVEDDLEATFLPTSYQQALVQYLTNELQGRVTAERYPPEGEGRITEVGSVALAIDTEALEGAPGWFVSEQLGVYIDFDGEWIWMESLGWVQFLESTEDNLVFYVADLDDTWSTSLARWPYVRSENNGNLEFYLFLDGPNAWLFDFVFMRWTQVAGG